MQLNREKQELCQQLSQREQELAESREALQQVQEDFNDSIKVFEQLNEEKAGAEQEAVECRTLAEEYQQLY